MLHENAVDKRLLSLVRSMSDDDHFKQFQLAGGTALALQLGHRKSKDIDMFTHIPFIANKMAGHILSTLNPDEIKLKDNTVIAQIDGIRVTLVAHQYKWLQPPLTDGGIRIAALDDIAAMKMHAVVNNGQRLKDFFDLYKILEHKSMNDIMNHYLGKYPGTDAQVAKMSLKYHAQIDFGDQIYPLGKSVKFNEIDIRFHAALSNPDKIFSNVENQAQQQVRSRKRE